VLSLGAEVVDDKFQKIISMLRNYKLGFHKPFVRSQSFKIFQAIFPGTIYNTLKAQIFGEALSLITDICFPILISTILVDELPKSSLVITSLLKF
jgi:hypothetical protein